MDDRDMNMDREDDLNRQDPPTAQAPAGDETLPIGAEEMTVEPPTEVAGTPEEEPRTTYRWTYAEQRQHDEALRTAGGQRKKTTGLWVYALVMTGVFLLSFGLLLVVMLTGGDDVPWAGDLQISTGQPENDPSSPADVAAVERAKASVVVIEVVQKANGGVSGVSIGTGIILTSDGYIATNHHVIENADKIRITFHDGSHAYADLVGSSAMDDLAVVKVSKTGLRPATFADSSECYTGQTVYAIGTPYGTEFAWTTTRGVISYPSREISWKDSDKGTTKRMRVIQTDATVNPGNSGGPLVDTEGRVIGVVSSKLGGEFEGIGFAIPSDGAIKVLDAIIKKGSADHVDAGLSYKRPLLGIVGVYVEKDHTYLTEKNEGKMIDVTGKDVEAAKTELIRAGGQPGTVVYAKADGVLVTAVNPGTGADGVLKVNDVITAVNGATFDYMDQMVDEINKHRAGESVTLDISRDGRVMRVNIVLTEQKN